MCIIGEAEMVVMQIEMDSRAQWTAVVYLNRARALGLIEGHWTRHNKLSYEELPLSTIAAAYSYFMLERKKNEQTASMHDYPHYCSENANLITAH